MAKVIVVARNHRLKGVFSQRQFAYQIIQDPDNLELGRDNQDYAMPCNYQNFCRILREQGKVWIEGGVVAWLVEVNEEV